MIEKVDISIIIPVYNASKYLRECLESAIAQPFETLEIIIINDGSTDDSENIILDYVSKDCRIRYEKQKNLGVSAARNRGLQIARGTWVCFVDADDYVSEDFCSIIMSALEKTNADILVFSRYIPAEEYIALPKERISIIKGILKLSEHQVYNDILLSSNCSKAYRRTVLKNNDIFFDESLINGEDMAFNLSVIFKAESMAFINSGFYYYRQATYSATKRLQPKILESDYKFQSLLQDYINQMDNPGELSDIFTANVIGGIITTLRLYFAHPQNEKTYKQRKKEFLSFISRDVYKSAIEKHKFLNTKQYVCIWLMRLHFCRLLFFLTKQRRGLSQTTENPKLC